MSLLRLGIPSYQVYNILLLSLILCTGDLPAGVLAGHVQLHVQPHDLLLHEPEVSHY